MNKAIKYIFLLFILSELSCTFSVTSDEELHSKIFITKDSTNRWGLPTTNFSIDRPIDYDVVFWPDKRYYLKLLKRDSSDIILSEITIGVAQNIDSTRIEKSLMEIDSIMNSYEKIEYSNSKISSNDQLLEKILSGSINYDSLGVANYQGDYRCMFYFKESKLLISTLCVGDSILFRNQIDILSSLRFNN